MTFFETDDWIACEAELSALYQQPGRFYHNLNHIHDCLDQLSRVETPIRREMQLALWFHDVIYDPTRDDNERASAEFAATRLDEMGVSESEIATVTGLIQITDHRSQPRTEEEKLIVDIDLSILGRDKISYQKYAADIRKEYSHVLNLEYQTGRKQVLESFLKREAIYQTEPFHSDFESIARANIVEEITQLS